MAIGAVFEIIGQMGGGLLKTIGKKEKEGAERQELLRQFDFNIASAKQDLSNLEFADSVVVEGYTDAIRKQRALAGKELGAIRSSYGAAGVRLEGSAMDVLDDSVATAEADTMRLKHQQMVKRQAILRESAGVGRRLNMLKETRAKIRKGEDLTTIGRINEVFGFLGGGASSGFSSAIENEIYLEQLKRT